MTVPVLDRQSGVPIRVYGVVPKLSLTPGQIWRGAPSIGDDTTNILGNMLGLSAAAIEQLKGERLAEQRQHLAARAPDQDRRRQRGPFVQPGDDPVALFVQERLYLAPGRTVRGAHAQTRCVDRQSDGAPL